jgi:hypothetical protein
MTHPVFLEDEDLLKLCQRKNFRDSGPGGQRRNKVETGVQLTHLESGLVARAAERRHQNENFEMALKRLRIELALNLRCDWQQVSALWQQRCSGGKVVCSENHHDFAGLLCECLNVLQLHEYDIKKCAVLLSLSSSQLIKFIKKSPPAFEKLNQQRLKQNKSRYQ